jgi:hypothetical protein
MSGGSKPPKPEKIEETEQERALAQVAHAQWTRYKEVLAPFEDKYLADLRTTDVDRARVAGQTAAGVRQQFDEGRAGMERDMFAAGVNPNSGKFQAAQSGLNTAQGATVGSATGRATQAADDLTYQNLQNAVRMGRGEALQATRGMSDLARDAAGEAAHTAGLQTRYNLGVADANNRFREGLVSSGFSAAGMGLAGWGGKPMDAAPYKQRPTGGGLG